MTSFRFLFSGLRPVVDAERQKLLVTKRFYSPPKKFMRCVLFSFFPNFSFYVPCSFFGRASHSHRGGSDLEVRARFLLDDAR